MSQTPDEMFSNLMMDDLTAYLAGEVAPRAENRSRADWPSRSHPENVYATDDSVGQFSTVVGPTFVQITNEAPHGVYANDGTTRKGPGTALPFHERGGVVYLDQTATALVDDEARALLAHATRGGR